MTDGDARNRASAVVRVGRRSPYQDTGHSPPIIGVHVAVPIRLCSQFVIALSDTVPCRHIARRVPDGAPHGRIKELFMSQFRMQRHIYIAKSVFLWAALGVAGCSGPPAGPEDLGQRPLNS